MSKEIVESQKPIEVMTTPISAGAEHAEAIVKIQAAVVMAKQFPRDEGAAMESILRSCRSPYLAEVAEYAYPRGGEVVTGPSIRLLEEIARCWGHMDYGMAEMESDTDKNVTKVKVWCTDYQAMTTSQRIMYVRNERHTKKRNYALTDPRDIYENLANFAARRLRKCMIEKIPYYVIEEAVAACRETQLEVERRKDPKYQQDKIIANFAKYNITQQHIEGRIKCPLSEITAEQVVDLRRVINALKEGNGRPSDYFDIPDEEAKISASAEEVLELEKETKQKVNEDERKPEKKTDGARQGDRPQHNPSKDNEGDEPGAIGEEPEPKADLSANSKI